MIRNFEIEKRLGLRCCFMSNSSSPQSTSETQLQGQVAGNGGVTSGALQVSGNATNVAAVTTESEGGIAASGGSNVTVTTDDPQVLEAAITANQNVSLGAETVAMNSATASNNAIATLESDFQTEQDELTQEASAVNLQAENAPAATIAAAGAAEGATAGGSDTKLTNAYYAVGIAAAVLAGIYYISKKGGGI